MCSIAQVMADYIRCFHQVSQNPLEPEHVSLLMYKLASLACDNATWHPDNNPDVAEVAGQAYDLVDAHLHSMSPKYVVLTTWNGAKLRYHPRPQVTTRVLAQCMMLLQNDALEPKQVATLTFALSQLRHLLTAGNDNRGLTVYDFSLEVGRNALRTVRGMEGRGQALLLGGMVGLDCIDQEVATVVADNMATNLDAYGPKDVAQLSWALAVGGAWCGNGVKVGG